MTISERHRGWLGFGGAKMKDDAKPDLKESFIWGYEYQVGEIDDHPIRGPNKWPSFIPSFKENALNYFDLADNLAKTLLEGFALGLDLKRDFFGLLDLFMLRSGFSSEFLFLVFFSK